MWYQYPKSSLFFWFYIGFRTFGFKCREQWRPANFPPPPFSYRIEVKLESLEKLRKMSKSHKNQNHEDQLRETWISTTTPKPDQKPYSWRAERIDIYIYRYRFFFRRLPPLTHHPKRFQAAFFHGENSRQKPRSHIVSMVDPNDVSRGWRIPTCSGWNLPVGWQFSHWQFFFFQYG